MTAPLVSTTDRPFQLLPPLDSEQRHILKQSIEKNGVLEPVVFDEDGEILDGHHRVEIAEELGIEYPRRVISDLDRPGKFAYALTVNVARRHLDQTARSGLVAQLRLRGMSIREIAKATGFSKTTVARDVDQLSHSGQLSQPDRITGADGKDRPATRPTPKTPGPVDAAVPPPADPGTTPAPTTPNAAGAGPAPVADAPVPGQGPDLTPDILRVLAAAGQAQTAGDIAPQLGRAVTIGDVQAALERLADEGRVDPFGRALRGNRMVPQWVLADESDPTVCLGADMDCGRPLPCPNHPRTPAERIAAVAEVVPEFVKPVEPPIRPASKEETERTRLVGNARRRASRIVAEMTTAVEEIEIGIAYGESGLVTAEMVARLRAQVDLLAQHVKEKKA